MVCDLAETYHLFDYKQLPPSKVAVLVSGLRADSRIKISNSGMKVSVETALEALITDYLALIWWSKTKDGQANTNRPALLFPIITGKTEQEEYETFSSPSDFEERRKELIRKAEENGD